MGHHVVHLARRPGGFLGSGPFGKHQAVAFGPFGPFGQRLQQSAAGVDVHLHQRPDHGAQQGGGAAPVSIVAIDVLPRAFSLRATARVDRTAFGVTASRGMAGRHLDPVVEITCAQIR